MLLISSNVIMSFRYHHQHSGDHSSTTTLWSTSMNMTNIPSLDLQIARRVVNRQSVRRRYHRPSTYSKLDYRKPNSISHQPVQHTSQHQQPKTEQTRQKRSMDG